MKHALAERLHLSKDDIEQGISDSPPGPLLLLKWKTVVWMKYATRTDLRSFAYFTWSSVMCLWIWGADTVPTAVFLRPHIIIHVSVTLRQSPALTFQRVKVDLDWFSLYIATCNGKQCFSILLYDMDCTLLHNIHFNKTFHNMIDHIHHCTLLYIVIFNVVQCHLNKLVPVITCFTL